MSDPVSISKTMTDYQKTNFATEVAFTALVNKAIELGLPLKPVTQLMYLPSQEVTRQFQLACRAVIENLTVEQTPSEPAADQGEAKP